jgi:hypothetical protein
VTRLKVPVPWPTRLTDRAGTYRLATTNCEGSAKPYSALFAKVTWRCETDRVVGVGSRLDADPYIVTACDAGGCGELRERSSGWR